MGRNKKDKLTLKEQLIAIKTGRDDVIFSLLEDCENLHFVSLSHIVDLEDIRYIEKILEKEKLHMSVLIGIGEYAVVHEDHILMGKLLARTDFISALAYYCLELRDEDVLNMVVDLISNVDLFVAFNKAMPGLVNVAQFQRAIVAKRKYNLISYMICKHELKPIVVYDILNTGNSDYITILLMNRVLERVEQEHLVGLWGAGVISDDIIYKFVSTIYIEPDVKELINYRAEEYGEIKKAEK
jgi:hypothetical protein